MKRILLSILSFLLVFLIALPFVANEEKQIIDSGVRSQSRGTFIETPDGFVHYVFQGPENGEIVVLVPGFSNPLFIFEPLSKILQKEGYRVLTMDLFGRGLSDRPDADYNPELFERELLYLFHSLNIQKPVNLIGTSMGGIIVAQFTLKHPEKVKKLALIAPAGFPMPIPFVGKLTRLPWIGDYFTKAFGDRALLKGSKTNFFAPEKFPEFNSIYKEQMKYIGFKKAILSSLRNMPLESFQNQYEKLSENPIPKLLIWGKDDKVIPFQNSEMAVKIFRGIEFLPLEKAGHVPHFESPERILPKLLEFLKK
ncbi:alpha/beta hydrolase [Leptospira sp. 201903070]|uniref:Alpha/beta hydrolase n=1 Tax=Leptospira ainlahdjerensis TaxID=2810033 RepID=A0ABS2UG21_9LEPT|nr:alpha/beta hydrolase [Leptospira ainlahdjerensis]MBM9579315.1 alpha/beta hydrolase [Leptospira ainlahdjerensis]